MKVERIKIGATIPIQQYGNLMPEIEISSDDIGEDILAMGIDVMKGLFNRYSEKGAMIERNIALSVTRKSFNEDVEILFEPLGHTYTVKDGSKLVSATDYIKRFYKEFDSETISSVLEGKWGVPKKVIAYIWDSNRDLTSYFGTLVHKCLEYYEKFKDMGDIIASKKGDTENYCLPKHPILRDIIKGFLDTVKGEKGEIITEVIISDVKNGVCGTVDRLVVLDKEKKICRIKDYKINIESEELDKKHKPSAPFNTLPENKLSKYHLQTSVYANIMQASGWTVEGIDIYVYEDMWKHFGLPVLQVIGI